MDIAFAQPFADPGGSAEVVRRFGRTAVVVLVFGALAVWGAAGALASTDAGGFTAHPVSVSATGGAMFRLPAVAPGRTVTRYSTVHSSGEPADLRLFASVSGTGLARFLTVTVTRGSRTADGFVPAGFDRGAGPGVVYSGPLSVFPRSWDGGIELGGTSATGTSATFRFDVTLANASAAQGLTAGAAFRWETRQA
jgi:hypothetical protein